MVQCLIALGSNQGDRVGNLSKALESLHQEDAVKVGRVSSFYETTPIGGPRGQEKYFNAAAIVETTLSPAEVLAALLAIERKLGRERGERWGPRTIDLDLLLYGDETIDEPGLTVPHPRLHERRFALEPLADLDPGLVIPRRGPLESL